MGTTQTATHARRLSRRLAMQAIYQWQMTRDDAGVIFRQFLEEPGIARADEGYFRDLLYGVVDHCQALDDLLAPHMQRTIDEVDPVERAILRLAAYELAHRPEVPYRVALNEGVELARRFGASEGHRFVNGVLDKVARRVRAGEAGRG